MKKSPDAISPTDILSLRLGHGQVRYVLRAMAFGEADGELAFEAQLKSLRKVGIPFGTAAPGRGGGSDLVYGWDEFALLVLAFALQEQGMRLRHLGSLFAASRDLLRDLLRQAIADVRSGPQGLVTLVVEPLASPGPADGAPHAGGTSLRIVTGGIWLHWPVVQRPSLAMEYGAPRLVGAAEAVALFVRKQSTLRLSPPLPISDLLDTALTIARQAPRIRRGRQPGVPQGPRRVPDAQDLP